MSKPPITLLEHPAQIKGDLYGIAPRAPARMRQWADAILVSCGLVGSGVDTKKAMQAAMKSDATDRLAHDAAWLKAHSVAGLKLINDLPSQHRTQLLKLWAHAFHAGARHESITVNVRYLSDVQRQYKRRTELPARARAARPERTSVARYQAAKNRARSRKELFAILEMSPQGVRDFERRHPELGRK